jgi:GT2 family glycosyltransferase
LILLNSDTIVAPNWDKLLIGWLEMDRLTKLVGYGGGQVDPSSLVGQRRATGYSPQYVEGWGLCLSRSTYQRFGLFDADNLRFAYGEDSDLSFRIREQGYTVYVPHTTLVYHFGNITSRTVVDPAMIEMSKSNHEYLKSRWGGSRFVQ